MRWIVAAVVAGGLCGCCGVADVRLARLMDPRPQVFWDPKHIDTAQKTLVNHPAPDFLKKNISPPVDTSRLCCNDATQ